MISPHEELRRVETRERESEQVVARAKGRGGCHITVKWIDFQIYKMKRVTGMDANT